MNKNPSKDDQNLTQKLKATCSTIDVQLHDHLIIAGNDYTSMADKGMVEMLMIDYVITFPTANLDQVGETDSTSLPSH